MPLGGRPPLQVNTQEDPAPPARPDQRGAVDAAVLKVVATPVWQMPRSQAVQTFSAAAMCQDLECDGTGNGKVCKTANLSMVLMRSRCLA